MIATEPGRRGWARLADQPDDFPPAWAVAWGDDRCGIWAELQVQGVVQRLRWMPPGEFDMGSPDDELERTAVEGPVHRVRISHGHWLADTTCSQALWMAVMGGNPSEFKGEDTLPVESVSWDDAQDFLRRLQQRLPLGTVAALPTEAEWECACRAGSDAPFAFGATINTALVNYDGYHPYTGAEQGLIREKTMPVSALPANGWGLHQMHGNVWEWCADTALRMYPTPGNDDVCIDPLAIADVSGKPVLRGGSWISGARFARSSCRYTAFRDSRLSYVGFRLTLKSRSISSEPGAGNEKAPRSAPDGIGPPAPV